MKTFDNYTEIKSVQLCGVETIPYLKTENRPAERRKGQRE